MTVDELLAIVTENSWKDPDQTISACEELMTITADNADPDIRSIALYFAAEAYYTKNDIERTVRFATSAMSYLDEVGDYFLMAKANNLMAITAMTSGNALTAMEYYINALDVSRKAGARELENMILINIGNLYLSYSDFGLAESYFKESIDFMTENRIDGDSILFYVTDYLGLGNCALYRGDVQSSLKYDELITGYLENYQNEGVEIGYLSFKARLYQLVGDENGRDEYIDRFQRMLTPDLPLLDYFDDLYDYAKLLLKLERKEEFLYIVDLLGELTERAKIARLSRKVTTLRINYCKHADDQDEYAIQMERFYRQTLAMEDANRSMMISMMTTRAELERERRLREKERREKERLENEKLEMKRRAETDGLTGIHNRAKFNEYAPVAYTRSLMSGRTFGIEILDIDYFKQFNDNYGHQMGDLCIITVASVLSSLEKTEGVSVYRYGGDEFIVVYEGLDAQSVKAVSEHLKAVVESHNMPHEYSPASDHVTISQGICVDSPRPDITVWEFLKCADNALYEVKKTSRNAIVVTNYINM